ncbi:DUF4124 domain-containing protein [Luteimonas salinilitoris]|uniref:DUF4124 domain-containing protein n=1 Tax=Luteimonas salinilitoris TaxID=3237697 RepID=A0ABV4HVZ9_9GAMM
MMRHALFCAALLLAAPAIAQKNEMVIYHCTDAGGAVTVQNDTPCPAGSTQKTRVIDPPPPLPAYVPMTPPPAPSHLAPITRVKRDDGFDPAALVIDLELQLPPPLFLCTTYDQTRYYTEDSEPASRCQPMATVGIGGLQGLGAGKACMQVTDVCEPVPDEALCEAWDARVDEAEFRWKFAGGHYATEDRRAEYEALARVRDTSTCAAE